LSLREALEKLEQAHVAAWLRSATASLRAFSAEVGSLDRAARAPWLGAAALAGVGALVFSPQPGEKFRPEYDAQRYPAKAIASVGRQALAGTIFADDEWGDYLIYRLYPDTRVFIDGRSDFYGAHLGKEMTALLHGRYDWRQKLESYAPQAAVLRADAPLASLLKECRRWRLVYDDGIAIVFRRAGEEARHVQVSAGRPGEADVIARSRGETQGVHGSGAVAHRGLASAAAAIHGSP